MTFNYFGLIIFMLLLTVQTNAQVNIVSVNFNALNVTPVSLCQANIVNLGSETTVVIEARLTNSANETLLNCKTNPLVLKQGLNAGINLPVNLEYFIYGLSGQANFVKLNHTLPSGNYKYCISISSLSAEANDDYCEEVQSELSSFLYLVDPFDHDTIITTHPLFVWTHSEPFNILSQGEFFRLVLVELSDGQNAESGVTVNIPVFQKDYVARHQVQHPFDIRELEKGKRYGWQIQKFSNGLMAQKSESWEFIIAPDIIVQDVMYGVVKKKIDGGFYTARNNKVYFCFDESYVMSEINCKIIDEKGTIHQPVVYQVEKSGKFTVAFSKGNGDNRFVIQLSELGLKRGYYTLEVKNSKREIFYLKFYVE